MKKRGELVAKAAGHHSTLNIFSGVISLLEGGTVADPGANTTSYKIIRLCKAECQRQLKKYDKAVAAATKDRAP